MFFVTAKSNKPPKLITKQESALGKVRSAGIEIPLDTKNYFYVRNWAVSGYERWGLNTNADGWRHKHLSNDYDTFNNAWVCLNHTANTSNDSIGKVLSPSYMPDYYVENILAVERRLADRLHPGLEKDILEGIVTDTSMGCVARASECTVCHNISETDDDYCEHLAEDAFGSSMKGQRIFVQGHWVVIGELYIDTVFYEDSILTDQRCADINAKMFEIAASRAGKSRPDKDSMYYAIKALQKEFGGGRVKAVLEAMERLS